MELQEMTSVTFMEEVLMPFCVQFNNGHTCLMTKDNTFVLIDEYNYSNHLNYFNSIRTKISCPKHVPTKEIDCNPLTIFEKGTLDEKQALMLDQTLMPGLSSPYIQSIKALVSTHDTNNPVLLAYLSSFGGLEISIRKNSNEWKQIADISKLNANKRKICNVFTDLQTTVNDIMIESIEWCNKIFHHTRYLLIKTKSEKLLIYAFKTNELREIEIKQCYSQQIEGIRLVKWVSTSKQEFLFLTDEVGNISIYNVNMKEDDIEELNLLEEVSARLKLPTSFITFTVTDKHILIVCSKSHSLEAFCFDKVGKFMSSTVQYVGLNVTGLDVIGSSMNFLAITLDGKVFCIRFKLQNQKLTVTEKTLLPTSIHPDRFAAYGIASSKNQVLFYVVLYPKQNFDHLVLRQPAILQLNHFLEVSPHDILINNPKLKLTDYYDCLELIWFMGARDVESLNKLQDMPFEVKIDDKFAYYLKLQLIVLNAKFTFFRRRSDMMVEEFATQIEFLSSLLQAVSCVGLLHFIYDKCEQKKKVPVAEITIKTAHYLRLFLRSVVDTPNVPKDFTDIFSALESSFNAVLNRTKSLKPTNLDPCFLCQENIMAGNIFCSAGHKTLRCSVTKLPLPLFTTNLCKHCQNAHLDLETLRIITFHNEDWLMCPLCDVAFE